MSSTEVLVLAFLIGVIAGLRSLTAPAVAAWAGYGRGILAHTSFHFMGTLIGPAFLYQLYGEFSAVCNPMRSRLAAISLANSFGVLSPNAL